jgi:hypothetical protein
VLNEARGTEEIAAVIETSESTAESRAELGRAAPALVLRTTGLTLRHVLLVPPGGDSRPDESRPTR